MEEDYQRHAEEFLPYSLQRAQRKFRSYFNIELSMGQRMILRRCMQKAAEHLNKNNVAVGSLDDYDLADEAIARLFIEYGISFSNELCKTVVRGYPLPWKARVQVNNVFGEKHD